MHICYAPLCHFMALISSWFLSSLQSTDNGCSLIIVMTSHMGLNGRWLYTSNGWLYLLYENVLCNSTTSLCRNLTTYLLFPKQCLIPHSHLHKSKQKPNNSGISSSCLGYSSTPSPCCQDYCSNLTNQNDL